MCPTRLHFLMHKHCYPSPRWLIGPDVAAKGTSHQFDFVQIFVAATESLLCHLHVTLDLSFSLFFRLRRLCHAASLCSVLDVAHLHSDSNRCDVHPLRISGKPRSSPDRPHLMELTLGFQIENAPNVSSVRRRDIGHASCDAVPLGRTLDIRRWVRRRLNDP